MEWESVAVGWTWLYEVRLRVSLVSTMKFRHLVRSESQVERNG
jgi:hypothetical protein